MLGSASLRIETTYIANGTWGSSIPEIAGDRMSASELPQAASAVHFDSDQLPARDRIPFTREVLGRACAKLEIEPVGDARFRLVSKFRSLPGLRVVTIESSPVRVTRSTELIAGDDNDDFVVAI